LVGFSNLKEGFRHQNACVDQGAVARLQSSFAVKRCDRDYRWKIFKLSRWVAADHHYRGAFSSDNRCYSHLHNSVQVLETKNPRCTCLYCPKGVSSDVTP
jgi:hypothetical protein